MQALAEIAWRASVLLIEDSAQAFPSVSGDSFWGGDLVIVSFGRGKPVSLLGGGAVLFREEGHGKLLPEPGLQPNSDIRQRFCFWLRATLYNMMISPYSYWLPQGLPFLHLGETRYHPLAELGAMDRIRMGLLVENVNAYQQRGMRVQSALSCLTADLTAAGAEMVDIPDVCQVPPDLRLLRYPLLLGPERCDRVYVELRRQGLGPSRMYPATLPEIPGLESYLGSSNSYPVARDFASRILALPLHEKVTEVDIDKVKVCLSSSGC